MVYVCQYRGCLRRIGPCWFASRYWLITEHINKPGWLVIRCPEHITRKVLERTKYGRTNFMLAWMEDCHRMAKSLPPPDYLMPFPVRFLGAYRLDSQDDVPDLSEFFDELQEHKRWKTKWSPEAKAKASKRAKSLQTSRAGAECRTDLEHR